MFPGFKPFKSTFILCFFKRLWKHSPLWSGTKQCIVRGSQARVKNADLRHPSCTVVMYRRKCVSPVHNVIVRRKQYFIAVLIVASCLLIVSMSVILAHFHWPLVPVLQWVQLPYSRRKIKIRLSLLRNEIHSRQDLYSLHVSKKGTVEINT